MIIQKKYYTALLLGMNIVSCAMEIEKQNIRPLIDSALRIQLNKSVREMKKNDEVVSISGGYYRFVVRRGSFTSVEQVEPQKPKL